MLRILLRWFTRDWKPKISPISLMAEREIVAIVKKYSQNRRFSLGGKNGEQFDKTECWLAIQDYYSYQQLL